jgi:hypothetical protein
MPFPTYQEQFGENLSMFILLFRLADALGGIAAIKVQQWVTDRSTHRLKLSSGRRDCTPLSP